MIYIIFFFILTQSISATAATVMDACGNHEKWEFKDERHGNWMNRYQAFLLKQESPWMAFSDSIQLRKTSRILSNGTFESDFSEYWVGKIFYELGLHSLAQEYFESSSEHAKTAVIKNASRICINKINQGLKPKIDQSDLTHLLRARELYSSKKMNESVAEFQKIDKRSNLKIDALSDLSWAYLHLEHYQEAVGIALQLRSGIFRNTFAPESMMVAAMALNETCSYQDASRMIQFFIQDYGNSFDWLVHSEKGSEPYHEILSGLKNQSSVPAKIRTEWVKHPVFLSRQEQINRLIENHRKIIGMPSKIQSLKSDLTNKNTIKISKLLYDVKSRKNDSISLAKKYQEIRKDIRTLIRFNRSSKTLLSVVQKHDATIPAAQSKHVAKINHELHEKNRELLTHLKKIRENIDLIEVEIYHGASKDMLGLKKSLKKKTDLQKDFDTAVAWNWGSFSASELERAEIWEDEIGDLKADTKNHCN